MRALACLLLVASVPALETPPPTAATPTGIDAAAVSAALAQNTVSGVILATRRLQELGGERYDLDAGQRKALYHGMPQRIRGYFSDADPDGEPVDLVGAAIVHDGDGYRLDLRFAEDWLAKPGERKHRLGGCESKGHQANIYLSRRALVTARIALEGIVDPRAAANAPVPYGIIQRDHGIFTEDIVAKKLRAHPWRDVHPLGLVGLEGLSIEIDVTGWWKNACDIQPCTHLVVAEDRPDAHIWLAYKELPARVDRKRGFMQISNDAFARGMTSLQAFPAYCELPPDPGDHFSVIDLTEEGAAKPTP